MTPREQIIALIGEEILTALESSGYQVRPRDATERMAEAGHRAHTADRGRGFYFDTMKIDTAMTAEWEREQNEAVSTSNANTGLGNGKVTT